MVLETTLLSRPRKTPYDDDDDDDDVTKVCGVQSSEHSTRTEHSVVQKVQKQNLQLGLAN